MKIFDQQDKEWFEDDAHHVGILPVGQGANPPCSRHFLLDPAIRERAMIRKELLEILACPKCKGPVQLNDEGTGIVCRPCKLLYEIRDSIPIMLIDEAKPLEEA
jgi:uncharacterized protein YbaR (Trm112 family)